MTRMPTLIPMYWFLFLLHLTLPFALQAQKDWEREYKTLCSYDKEWCSRIKKSDGSWARPRPEMVELKEVCELSDKVNKLME